MICSQVRGSQGNDASALHFMHSRGDVDQIDGDGISRSGTQRTYTLGCTLISADLDRG